MKALFIQIKLNFFSFLLNQNRTKELIKANKIESKSKKTDALIELIGSYAAPILIDAFSMLKSKHTNLLTNMTKCDKTSILSVACNAS
jgi:hypothetical protein